jgi:hypothetical protein
MATKTCKILSQEDHQMMAGTIIEAHRKFLETYQTLADHYGRTSREARRAWTVVRKIADLRYEMDSTLFRERECTKEPAHIMCYFPDGTFR